MNYLAHCYLADHTATSIAGSLMGDFVRGPLEGRLPPEIERGIQLHRRVDSFTDQHPVVLAAKRRIDPPYRRYAGILLDIFFDHFLAKAWPQFHSESLEQFADRVYIDMSDHAHLLGDRMRVSLDYMRSRNLLVSYREPAGIERALRGVSTRLSRANPLADGASILRTQHADLERDFEVFFPLLTSFAASEIHDRH